jgi:hypothetical protein
VVYRRAETIAAYLTSLRAPKVPARSRAKLEQLRTSELGVPASVLNRAGLL